MKHRDEYAQGLGAVNGTIAAVEGGPDWPPDTTDTDYEFGYVSAYDELVLTMKVMRGG
jgi:hypothetical protein